MEQLYYFTGLVFIWILSFFGALFIAIFLIKSLIEILAKKIKSLWIIVEYALNRKQYKEYLKNSNSKKCDLCKIPYQYDWSLEYTKCPKCGNDI